MKSTREVSLPASQTAKALVHRVTSRPAVRWREAWAYALASAFGDHAGGGVSVCPPYPLAAGRITRWAERQYRPCRCGPLDHPADWHLIIFVGGF